MRSWVVGSCEPGGPRPSEEGPSSGAQRGDLGQLRQKEARRRLGRTNAPSDLRLGKEIDSVRANHRLYAHLSAPLLMLQYAHIIGLTCPIFIC